MNIRSPVKVIRIHLKKKGQCHDQYDHHIRAIRTRRMHCVRHCQEIQYFDCAMADCRTVGASVTCPDVVAHQELLTRAPYIVSWS